MYKNFFVYFLLFQSVFISADFILETIENKSDLKFDYVYYRSLGQQKRLPALDDILQKSQGKQHVVVDKTITSRGLAFVMSDNQGHTATIFIHDQTKLAIEHKRSKTQQIAKFPVIVAEGKGDYTAQIMMIDRYDTKLITKSKAYNHQDSSRFNLIITGKEGNYQILLDSIDNN